MNANRAVAVLFLAVGLPATSCGGDSEEKPKEPAKQPSSPAKVDVSAIESSLVSSLGRGGTTGGPKVSTVECPSTVPARAGASFKCTASGSQGLTGPVNVTLKDAQGKAYAYKGKLKGSGVTQEVSGTATGR